MAAYADKFDEVVDNKKYWGWHSDEEITRHFPSLALRLHPLVADTPYPDIHQLVEMARTVPQGIERQIWFGLTDIDVLFSSTVRSSMHLNGLLANDKIDSPTWFRLVKMGLYDHAKPPSQAQIQCFRFAACLSVEAMKKFEQLQNTIKSQHERIRELEHVTEEVGGVDYVFLGYTY